MEATGAVQGGGPGRNSREKSRGEPGKNSGENLGRTWRKKSWRTWRDFLPWTEDSLLPSVAVVAVAKIVRQQEFPQVRRGIVAVCCRVAVLLTTSELLYTYVYIYYFYKKVELSTATTATKSLFLNKTAGRRCCRNVAVVAEPTATKQSRNKFSVFFALLCSESVTIISPHGIIHVAHVANQKTVNDPIGRKTVNAPIPYKQKSLEKFENNCLIRVRLGIIGV